MRRVSAAALLSLAAISVLLLPAVPDSASADEQLQSFPFMQPDEETLRRWIDSYETAPRFDTGRAADAVPVGHLDLLDHLDYIPAQNSQGSCGNCWAWAGTSALGIALDVQKDIHERLSVQFINSCQQRECCRGGWLSDFAAFYDSAGLCIPWENEGAYWQDGTRSCSTACDSISTAPSYEINTIGPLTVPTKSYEGVTTRETAIRNIKTVLDQHRAVWFAYFVPDAASWMQFTAFWQQQGETAVLDLDSICSGTTTYGGHAVLCVGYDDTDPNNRYWVMLNSWGTAGGGRPNGLFRINMDMDYNSRCGIDAFYWQTLDVSFGMQPQLRLQPESLALTVLQFSTAESTFEVRNDGDGDLLYEAVTVDPEGSGGNAIALAHDDGLAEAAQNGEAGTRFAVRFAPPSCPSVLTSASVELAETGADWPSGDEVQFGIEVYANDGDNGAPGTLIGGTTFTTGEPGWKYIDLSSLDVVTGTRDFYIAIHFLQDAPAHVAIGLDESTVTGRSLWRESGGVWLPVDEPEFGPGEWLIHCALQTLESAWVSTAPSSGAIAPGALQNMAVTVDATGLTAGTRDASIVVASNDLTSNPTVLPVSVTVLPAADLVPVILCPTWVDLDAGTYSITCAVANEAFGATGSSVALLSIDGTVVLSEPVPELGPGESHAFTYDTALTEDSDTLVLTVDSDDDVYWESSEVNNNSFAVVALPRTVSLQVSLAPGWNMVSVPLLLENASIGAVFPTAAAVYTWDPDKKTYISPDAIEPDTAYWIAVSEPSTVSIEGLEFTEYVKSLTPGWHMLGSVCDGNPDLSQPKDAPQDSVLPFAYSWNTTTKSYDSTAELQTGLGYWVAATQDCLLQVS